MNDQDKKEISSLSLIFSVVVEIIGIVVLILALDK